ncbi:hypothetical protein [Paenibacillus elgii]|uniref:hypothetical protein n=1 Tax=Paenibacillus elgii TaxID=189691 RepID=UPI000248DAC1|nr:hypothetical protein [Paenibacillus elgii]
MERVAKYFGWLYPLLLALIILAVAYKFGFNSKVKYFDKVLDGSITFSSIVVGFLGALLGILISIRDSSIVKAIFETNEKKTLKLYFQETFIIGFAVVIFSCTMHVMRDESSVVTDWLFTAWILVAAWFIPSTYRIVSILMSVFFSSNISIDRPQGNKTEDPQTREQMRKNLTRYKE